MLLTKIDCVTCAPPELFTMDEAEPATGSVATDSAIIKAMTLRMNRIIRAI